MWPKENRDSAREPLPRKGGGLSRRQLLQRGGGATALGLLPASCRSPQTETADDRFYLPAAGIEVQKTAFLLAIDDVSLPLKKNLGYYLSKPEVRKEPVLRASRDLPDAPDALGAHFYGTVLHDQGKFRMWYFGNSLGVNPDWPPEAKAQLEKYALRFRTEKLFDNFNMGPICYAESEDGIRWTKPNLSRMRFKGSKENNALALPAALIAGATLIKDEEDPHPDRRYKLVYLYYEGRRSGSEWGTIRTAISGNGLDWKVVGPRERLDDFIEQAAFYKYNGLYIVTGQKGGGSYCGEGGHLIGRQGFAWVSPDFDNWLPESVDSFTLPEPRNPQERGGDKPYDQVHLGVGTATYGNVLVGLYGLWHNSPDYHTISCDLGLVVSCDGLRFHEPVKGYVFLSADESPATPVGNIRYPTILCQANGIVNVGNETRIYHGRWFNAPAGPDYSAEVALATLPRDRWGALGLVADSPSGSVWSAPIRLPRSGCHLFLNADGAKGMRVEISDERFQLLPEHSDQNSGVCAAEGGFDCPVRWPRANLSSLAGKTVRLRIHLKQGDHPTPRLYAASLKVDSPI